MSSFEEQGGVLTELVIGTMLVETRNWWVAFRPLSRGPTNIHNQLAHSEFKGKPIIGGKDCEGVTRTPKNGEGFKIGDIAVKALYTPCHTQDSICWFMEDSTGRVIFTGDTLFHGGESISSGTLHGRADSITFYQVVVDSLRVPPRKWTLHWTRPLLLFRTIRKST